MERRSDRGEDTLILCYHAISASWPADLAITLAQLRLQLEWLVRHGYRAATFSEAVTAHPPGRTVAITFDDAFSSVLEQAVPLMAALRLPGTVFVVTDFAESGRPLAWDGLDHWADREHAGELRGMSWSQLKWLEQSGWEVGSHTRTHPRLTMLDDDALADELCASRAACERALGHGVSAISYPYGDVDARVMRAAVAAGYTTGAGLPLGLVSRSALNWPRIAVYRPDSMSRFRLKASPTARRVRTALAPAEVAVRRALHRRSADPAPVA